MMKYSLWILLPFLVVACVNYSDNIKESSTHQELRNKNLAMVIVTEADIKSVIKETKAKK